MAATTGLGLCSMTSRTSWRIGSFGGLPNSVMSAPAMKVRPAQAMTTASTPGAAAAWLIPSRKPRRTPWLSALTGGLLTVRTAIRPRRSRSTSVGMGPRSRRKVPQSYSTWRCRAPLAPAPPEGRSVRPTLRRALQHQVELFPADLVPGGIPVHELAGEQVVFRDRGIVPPHDEIMVEGREQARRALPVLEHILRHDLNIQAGMVVLHPAVVAEDRQLPEGRIRIELEADTFLRAP